MCGGIFVNYDRTVNLIQMDMKTTSSVSPYEAPACELFTVEVETVFLGTNETKVTVAVPEVEDSGYTYDF